MKLVSPTTHTMFRWWGVVVVVVVVVVVAGIDDNVAVHTRQAGPNASKRLLPTN